MSNAFGERFRITTFGESHGPAIGVVIDGCPAGVRLRASDVAADLARDVPDPSIGTARREPNVPEILSGVFEERTLGTPIAIVLRNRDAVSADYAGRRDLPRPGHGDLAYRRRYGVSDWRGGGRASGRECVARLAAGAVARRILSRCGIRVRGGVVALAGLPARTPQEYERARLHALEVSRAGDSTGGIVRVTAAGVPPGLGDPVFDKMAAVLGHALLSIGGVRSFEVGMGRRCASLKGSECNDPYVVEDGEVRTRSNRGGGIEAGITNGKRLSVRIAVKPTPTIRLPQDTVDLSTGEAARVRGEGRFDLNFAPRVAVAAEAMTCLVLVDRLLCAGEIDPLRLSRSRLVRRLRAKRKAAHGEGGA